MTTFLRRYPWVPALLVGVFWIAAVVDARSQLRALALTVTQLAAPLVAEAAEPPPARPTPVCVRPGDIPLDVREVGERTYEIERSALDFLLGDLGRLSRSARVVPEIRDGQPVGFRLWSVRPDGLAARFGFRSGDLILSINDLDISSPENALEAYAKLRTATSMDVAMERQGQRLTNSYLIR